MFTQKIIDSDAFLDMPLSTQALYFHLNMRADDDGFINNPKRIQRTIGASDDDLKLLIAKRFVICFENGVIVIKHWRMHNTLRKDRYNPTTYQEELALLEVKDNNAYTEKADGNHLATTWQPNGNHLATQYSKDKYSLVEIREVEEITADSNEPEPEEPPHKEKTDCQLIADLYNSICVSLPSIKSLSEARKKAIKARLKTYTVADFETVFRNAEASSFLKGANDRNWTATFDWLIKDTNMAKVLDGNYVDKPKCYGKKEIVPDWCQHDGPDAKAIEQMQKLRQKIKTAGNDEGVKQRAEDLKRRLGG